MKGAAEIWADQAHLQAVRLILHTHTPVQCSASAGSALRDRPRRACDHYICSQRSRIPSQGLSGTDTSPNSDADLYMDMPVQSSALALLIMLLFTDLWSC